QIGWDFQHKIVDLAANRFDRAGANATFFYELLDPTVPVIADVFPPKGLKLRRLRQIEITFSKAVDGVTAGDLLLNGHAATEVLGNGAGPYIFIFPEAEDGSVRAE